MNHILWEEFKKRKGLVVSSTVRYPGALPELPAPEIWDKDSASYAYASWQPFEGNANKDAAYDFPTWRLVWFPDKESAAAARKESIRLKEKCDLSAPALRKRVAGISLYRRLYAELFYEIRAERESYEKQGFSKEEYVRLSRIRSTCEIAGEALLNGPHHPEENKLPHEQEWACKVLPSLDQQLKDLLAGQKK